MDESVEIAEPLPTTEQLLRKLLVAVIEVGRADIIWNMPDILDYMGSRIPTRIEVAHLHNVNEQMLEAGERHARRRRKPRLTTQ